MVQTAVFDETSGTFTVPAWTTAVFVLPQGSVEQPTRGEETAVDVTPTEEPETAEDAAPVEETEADVTTEAEAEEAHGEAEMIEDAPGTPWLIWLGALGGGFLFALIVAWASRRQRHDKATH